MADHTRPPTDSRNQPADLQLLARYPQLADPSVRALVASPSSYVPPSPTLDHLTRNARLEDVRQKEQAAGETGRPAANPSQMSTSGGRRQALPGRRS
jgi:hypothetical protein